MLLIPAGKIAFRSLSFIQRNAKQFSTSCAVLTSADENGYFPDYKYSRAKLPEDNLSLQTLEETWSEKNKLEEYRGQFSSIRRSKEEINFDKHFRLLKNGARYSSYKDAMQLAYLPLVSYRAYRETVFIEQLCHLWWTSFQPFLTTQPILPSDLVKGTLFGLNKLDETTNGHLSKVLASTNSILSLSDCILKSILLISPNNFDLFLNLLSKFFQYGQIRNEDTVELKKKLNKAFPVFLSAALNGKLYCGFHITKTVTKTAFRFQQEIGIDKPADQQALQDLVHLFGRVINEMEHSSYMLYIRDLHLIALVLVRWNIDANKYDAIFWSNWYKKMAKYYNGLNLQTGFFNALSLCDWLLVALKFDQEKEFLKVLPFWLDAFRVNRYLLYPENIEILINQTKKKYFNDPLHRIDEASLTNIVKVLEGRY